MYQSLLKVAKVSPNIRAAIKKNTTNPTRQRLMMAHILPARNVSYDEAEYIWGFSSYIRLSLFEITSATMPQMKHTTIDRIPSTSVVVAFGKGLCSLNSPGVVC